MELTAADLVKSYGDQPALRGVSFTAGPGIVALLGPNGSGKSTLLRLLATVTRPDQGEIQFGGRRYGADVRPIRRVLGYLPQTLELPPHLTARRFLHYMAGLKQAPAEPQSKELLDALGLAAEADRPLGQLSHGQLRRVGVVQALLGNPRLLVLDEPTVGLDPEERDRVLHLVGRPATGRVVLLSSHVPGEVEAVARQVVVLREGRVRFDGTPEEMRAAARGQVHETKMPAQQIEVALQTWRVSRVTVQGERALMRMVGAAPAGAIPVEPSLEDAYLLL